MRDLWLQFLMIGPYTGDIKFLVNNVEIIMLPIKGIDTIFGNVTYITTGCIWVRPILLYCLHIPGKLSCFKNFGGSNHSQIFCVSHLFALILQAFPPIVSKRAGSSLF